MPEAAAGHNTLVSRTKTLLASMAHECMDRTSRRAEIPPPELRAPWVAALVITASALVTGGLCYRLLRIGYKLKT